MTEEEKYYSINKDNIKDAILSNSKGLVYDYKFNEWQEFIKYKKDDPKVLKILSFTVRLAYLEKQKAITKEDIEKYKKLSQSERKNISILLNTFFDEDIAYSILSDIEMNESDIKSI